MQDISHAITQEHIKAIFGNKANAEKFLNKLSIPLPAQAKADDLYTLIEDNWDYQRALTIIRSLFLASEKYKSSSEFYSLMQLLESEWDKLNLGEKKWPFSQGQFDHFVQQINAASGDGSQKDQKVKRASVQFRRFKEINTYRHDYLEALILAQNQNILPTLTHTRGVDFFINGIKFDQKVASSPTNEFKKEHGDNWRQIAIDNPVLVAEYLYRYQDEGRFGAEPRLLIVYLDEDISLDVIQQRIQSSDLQQPSMIRFTYEHKAGGVKYYDTQCFVILLYR